MGKHWSTLSIEQLEPYPRSTKVLLNGQPIPGLRGVTVEWGTQSATIATLELMIDELHVSAEVMVQLRALMEAQQPETRPTVVAPLPGDE